MARVFVTGSSEGLGFDTAQRLAASGHRVTLHARSAARAAETAAALPNAEAVVAGDLSTIAGMRDVAEQVNALGAFDAVIHNVGIGYREPRRVVTADGLSLVFAVNVLAPYLLTAEILEPSRLIYLSSGLHTAGDPSLEDLQWERRTWDGTQAYSDSKFLDVLLAFGIARRWPHTRSNALEPGWVATKMGGPGAPDDRALGSETQAWLAVSDDPAAAVTGSYFKHRRPHRVKAEANDPRRQDRLLDYCAELTGTPLPD